MSELIKEYGKAVLSILTGLVAVALLFIVLSGGSYSGMGKGLDEKFICEYPPVEQPHIETFNETIPANSDFDWKDYVIATDSRGNSLINYVHTEGEIDTSKLGIQVIGFSLQYRGQTKRAYAFMVVQEVSTFNFTITDKTGTVHTYEAIENMTWDEWINSHYYCHEKRINSPMDVKALLNGKKLTLENGTVVSANDTIPEHVIADWNYSAK